MGYTDDESMVRVDFFKEGGKWYTTEAVKWTGSYYGTTSHGLAIKSEIQDPLDGFAKSLRDHLNKGTGRRLSEMTAVCLKPHHEFSFPLMIKNGQWNKKFKEV